jgi:protein-L-isoaspartate(D-aspartate) O-methyltransferase
MPGSRDLNYDENFYLCHRFPFTYLLANFATAMRKYEDTYKHKGMRHQLIIQLRQKGITDENVLHAIEHIPRHFFLDSAFEKIAYEDRAFPIGEGQTISQPYTVAYQTQLLNVRRNDKVLEIGTGSAYQATVLAEMGARVYTIERQRKLYEKNKDFIFKIKYPNIKFFYGDGFEGLPAFAPFDKVIVTAAAPFVPPKLLEQMRPGGMMVIPLDEGDRQRMLRITKNGDGTLDEEYFDYFSFVPMLGGKKE